MQTDGAECGTGPAEPAVYGYFFDGRSSARLRHLSGDCQRPGFRWRLAARGVEFEHQGRLPQRRPVIHASTLSALISAPLGRSLPSPLQPVAAQQFVVINGSPARPPTTNATAALPRSSAAMGASSRARRDGPASREPSLRVTRWPSGRLVKPPGGAYEGRVQYWLAAPVQDQICSRVPLAELCPVASRHLPDCALTRVPFAPGCHI